MASLKSIIQKGCFYYNWGDDASLDTQANYRILLKRTIRQLDSLDTILVNAQTIWDDLIPIETIYPDQPDYAATLDRILHYQVIPRPKPPYPSMWIEAFIKPASGEGWRIGALVTRKDVRGGNLDSLLVDNDGDEFDPRITEQIREDSPTTLISISLWHEIDGSACWTGEALCWLDAAGTYQRSARIVIRPGGRSAAKEEYESAVFQMRVREGWVLHAFARMNCANARLAPISGQQRHTHRRDKPVPMSTWHTIQITSVPKIRTHVTQVEPDGEHSELRFHWVRGHYADYTKGAGLFGNPKLRSVFWIPEHRAGKEELGTVVSSYAVQ